MSTEESCSNNSMIKYQKYDQQYLNFKQKYDQMKNQYEREVQQYRQQLERQKREYEFRMNEIKEQEHKYYQKELQIIREDLTYKLHIAELEKNQQIKKLNDDIQKYEENKAQQSKLHKDQLTNLEYEWSQKLQQKIREQNDERQSFQIQLNAQLKNLEDRRRQDIEQYKCQMKQDKTDIFQSLENQKKNDFKQIIEQYENKILLIQSEYEKIQKESKEDWESRIKSIQEQLDLEKSNTALFRRRALEAKQSYDSYRDQIEQENQIIVERYKTNLMEERKAKQEIQNLYENYRSEQKKNESKLSEDYIFRENNLRYRVQQEINDIYERQIQMTQQLNQQYKELDEAAQIKYEKLKIQYGELEKQLMQETQNVQENRRSSLRRVFQKRSDEQEPPLQDVLSVLNNVKITRNQTYTINSQRQKKKVL